MPPLIRGPALTDVVEPPEGRGGTGPPSGPVLPGPETQQLVVNHGVQPATERTALRVIFRLLTGVAGHDAEGILHQVRRIGDPADPVYRPHRRSEGCKLPRTSSRLSGPDRVPEPQ